jgi:MFS transporter, ACS family, tartrate transporter
MASELESRTMGKVAFRIVPFIMLLYFIAYLDRVNIGFAALTMNKDLGFSPAVFGGSAAAAGIATINSIGNLGGFVGPAMIGWIKDLTGSFLGGLYFVAGLLVVSAVLTLVLAKSLQRRPGPEAAAAHS